MKTSTVFLAILSTFVTGSIASSLPPAIAESSVNNHAATVFRAEDAARILGGAVVAGTANSTTDMGDEKWYLSHASYARKIETSKDEIPASLFLVVRHNSNAEEARRHFLENKQKCAGVTVTSSFFKQPAYRISMPAQLHVLNGENWLNITAGSFNKPNLIAQEKLAQVLLQRNDDLNVVDARKIKTRVAASTQKKALTAGQAIALVKQRADVKAFLAQFPQGKSRVTDGVAIVDAEKLPGAWNVHVYEQMSDHTATMNWFEVNAVTGKIKAMTEE
jgi:hypothetical protein